MVVAQRKSKGRCRSWYPGPQTKHPSLTARLGKGDTNYLKTMNNSILPWKISRRERKISSTRLKIPMILWRVPREYKELKET